MSFDINNLRIGVIGLGYVGLPLAVEFGKRYPTVGFDVNAARIEELRGRARIRRSSAAPRSLPRPASSSTRTSPRRWLTAIFTLLPCRRQLGTATGRC